MSTGFEQRLAQVLAREIPGFKSLSNCLQLTAGASQETYRVSVDTGSGERVFALRRAQPLLEDASSLGGISLETEATLLRLADGAGVPVPSVAYVLQPNDELGSGFLMQWLEGETLGQRIVRSDELADIRPALARQCGEALGRIHSIDWAEAGLQAQVPTLSPEELVDQTFQSYRDLNVPAPMIDFCWRWLKENLPGSHRQALVHGDFRNGNLMITPEGISAVLDWELAQIGDPLRDLGWLCVNSWRFGQTDLTVGGFGTLDELLAGYETTAGISVSREDVLFWQVFGSFWWATATLQMAGSWRSGGPPSLERPVIGRRSSEAQMDCVNLLIPGDYQLPDTGRALSEGTQLPMPAELLSGVIDFLKHTAADQLDPHNSFLAKVAANSLGIATREFSCGPELASAEEKRLSQLLDRAGTLDELRCALVNALRDGLPLHTPNLDHHLRQTVAGQLAIDQPRYSALH